MHVPDDEVHGIELVEWNCTAGGVNLALSALDNIINYYLGLQQCRSFMRPLSYLA